MTFLITFILQNTDFDSDAETTNNGVFYNLDDGYYLIEDSTDVSGQDTNTLYIVRVVGGNVTVNRKADVPQSDKKLKDKNDTDGTTTDWTDSADWDIGDEVPFKISATIASDYANYTKGYSLTFHDSMDDGLTFDPKSVAVYVNGTKLTNTDETTYYEVVLKGSEKSKDNCTFEVQFADTTKIPSVKAGSVITVEYTATLNKDAKIGSEGNWNRSHITFTNNPNVENFGDEGGSTPEDKVVVFTYEFKGTKVDEQGKPLAGAKFALYKKVIGEDGQTSQKLIGTAESTISDSNAVFGWTGLDDGDYVLEETEAPAGYKKMADIEFTITAKHTDDSDSGDLRLTELKCSEEKFTATASSGLITGEIENTTSSTLPSTGGIGTTIFYTIGGIMVVAAVVLLITKKRMKTNK